MKPDTRYTLITNILEQISAECATPDDMAEVQDDLVVALSNTHEAWEQRIESELPARCREIHPALTSAERNGR